MVLSRRGVITSAGAASVAGAQNAEASSSEAAGPDAAWLQSVLERYAGFGRKASGGAGDEACRAWLEGELGPAGYACTPQRFEIPFFEARAASLVCGDARAEVIPQAVVKPTGPQGLSAPLRRADCGHDLAGAIALIVLPYKRWVSLLDPEVARPLGEAFRRGAAAAVLVTTGPTGEAIALNVSLKQAPFDRLVAVLAPKSAAPFLAAAAEGAAATLVLDGNGGRRTAVNLIARLNRNAQKTLVLSTPRSGWFTCAAERGSGLAVWLYLARWLTRANLPANLELLCTSGHEYEYIGGELYLSGQAPPPASTKLWCHVGASAAARDWHELGHALLPLPSADSQRVLTATADIVQPVRRAFAGVTGLEATYVATKATAGGEMTNVLKAGYASTIGLYGGHRYFHTEGDDLRCVSGDLVRPVASSFQRALAASLRT